MNPDSAGSLSWLFPMLKYEYTFSNKIYGSNFIKRHSETVTVWNYQNAIAVFKKFIVSFIIMFGTLWFPIDITTSVQTERVRKASSGVA